LEDHQLLFLYECIGKVRAEKECHIRESESDLTPERMYDITLSLTGDVLEAEKQKAFRWLEINRSENT
jgi:hypothetical protein